MVSDGTLVKLREMEWREENREMMLYCLKLREMDGEMEGIQRDDVRLFQVLR